MRIIVRIIASMLFSSTVLFAQSNILTLDEAVRTALENHVSPQKSASQVRLAEQEAKQQRATLLPTLSLTSDVSRPGPNLRQDPWLNAASRTQYETVWRTGLQAKWTVFDGGGNSNVYESKKILVEAAKENEKVTRMSLQANVTLAYWELVKQQQILDLARKAREYSNERLHIAESQLSIGSGNFTEVQQALLDRNADSATELKQTALKHQAERQLNWWMGRPTTVNISVQDTLQMVSVEKPLLEQVNNHPSVKQATLKTESARAMAKSVRSQWLPDVALYATYNFLEQYSDNPPPTNGHYQGMLYGIQLSLPLYEGGQTIAKIQAAQETEASQQLALRETKENWMNDVANASASLEQAIALAELEQGNAAIADSLQGQALKRFEMGALSGIELRKIQTATFDAQERLVLALFSAKSAEIELQLLFP